MPNLERERLYLILIPSKKRQDTTRCYGRGRSRSRGRSRYRVVFDLSEGICGGWDRRGFHVSVSSNGFK